jgi:hypothetical protein
MEEHTTQTHRKLDFSGIKCHEKCTHNNEHQLLEVGNFKDEHRNTINPATVGSYKTLTQKTE